uniref:Uncharacterized protein n=1 Tax=Solanum lycopersicum TaxID=4081 RepID=A0A3Q7G3Y9_SOLLC
MFTSPLCCAGLRLITSSSIHPNKTAYQKIYLLWVCASPNNYSIPKQNHTFLWSKSFGSYIKRRKLTKKKESVEKVQIWKT